MACGEKRYTIHQYFMPHQIASKRFQLFGCYISLLIPVCLTNLVSHMALHSHFGLLYPLESFDRDPDKNSSFTQTTLCNVHSNSVTRSIALASTIHITRNNYEHIIIYMHRKCALVTEEAGHLFISQQITFSPVDLHITVGPTHN